MKNKLTIAFLLIINMMQSQKTVSLTNYSNRDLGHFNYLKDTHGALDKFVGTWKYTNGNEEFTIKIIKVEKTDFSGTRNYYIDALFGGYKYVKNGNILVDRLSFTTDIYDFQNCAIMFGSGSFFNSNRGISLLGDDAIFGKPLYIKLEITEINQMHWAISPRENVNINNSMPIPGGPGFGIPKDIILTKQ